MTQSETNQHPGIGRAPAHGTGAAARPRQPRRSAGAVAAGFAAVVVLSLVTDQALHMLDVYPPWGETMHEPGLNLLALAYRSVYTVGGMYLTARLAPHSPMRHALVGGAIGTALAGLGAVATIPMQLGPAWYPILLAVTALPLAWLGGWIYVRRAHAGPDLKM
jgi:hypothetical protein